MLTRTAVSVRLFNALMIDRRGGWLMSWNLLDEPHRSAAQPQDREPNARSLPPLEPHPPHDDKLASQLSFLYLHLCLVPGPYIELFAGRLDMGCLGESDGRPEKYRPVANCNSLLAPRLKQTGAG